MSRDWLNAHCDALAMALSRNLGCGIRTLHAVHIDSTGGRRMDPDFLHAYAVDGTGPIDARGRRMEEEIIDEFHPLMQSLRRPDDACMEIQVVHHDGWNDLIESSGVDPDRERIDEASAYALSSGLI